MIMIPGKEPITTTLTPEELTKLLPTLHTYIEPSQPSVVNLPANSIYYDGLVRALRWREAGDTKFPGIQGKVVEFIQNHQALAFLGNKPEERPLALIAKGIQQEIQRGLGLEEVQGIWALRHYLFTEQFVEGMLKYLVSEHERMSEEETTFHGRTSADAELDSLIAESCAVFAYVDKEEELHERFVSMQAREQFRAKQAKRDRRLAMVLQKPSAGANPPTILGQARPTLAWKALPQLIAITK